MRVSEIELMSCTFAYVCAYEYACACMCAQVCAGHMYVFVTASEASTVSRDLPYLVVVHA